MDNSQNIFSHRQNKVALIAFLILLFILVIASIWMVAPYLLAVLMGGIFSILSRKLFLKLQEKGLGPKTAALLITIGAALLLVVPLIIFGSLAITQAIETAHNLSSQEIFSFETISKYLSKWKFSSALIGDTSEVENQIREGLKKIATMAPGIVLRIFGGAPELILQLVLGLVSSYFFAIDGIRFLNWLRDKIPLDKEVRYAIFNSFQETSVSTIVSTMTAASVQTLIVTIGFLVLGVPAAFLAAGATFIFAWVPLIGSTPVWGSGAIYLFIQGKIVSGFIMIGFGMLTGISDNFVYPWVLKGRGEMHPLVSLVSIFGGIHLFGILGVFIGPIIASILTAVLDIWPVIANRFGILKECHVVQGPTGIINTESDA